MRKEIFMVTALGYGLLLPVGTAMGAEPLDSGSVPEHIGIAVFAAQSHPPALLDLQLAQAGTSVPAPADPAPTYSDMAKEGARQAAETAQALKRTFQQQLLGKSVTVGAADVLTGATLTTSAGTFESYTGPDTVTPAIAFNSSSAHGLIVNEYDVAGMHFLDSVNFLANYAQFNADKQTVQKLSAGRSPSGFVRGDFLYGVALLAYNGIYESPSINWGFRAGAGLGAAVAQFDGRIDYSLGGQNRSETFSHGYDQPLFTYVMLVEGRIGNVVISGQSVELFGDVRTKQTHAHFNMEMGLVTLQVGYAFFF